MAKYKECNETMIYRFYVTESLYAQGEGKRLTKHYIDIIEPKPVDDRSGDEIAQEVIDRLGLKVE